MISAKEALEISENCKEDIIEKQLNMIEACIKEGATKGKRKINYNKPLIKNTIDTIKKQGYKVETKFTTTNELYYVISWG